MKPTKAAKAVKAAKVAVRAVSQRQRLQDTHKVFTRWLGGEYDLGSLSCVLSSALSNRLDGEPLWLMLLSGSGNAKTETVSSLAGIGAHIISSIASEGALLSATPTKEMDKGATGGLLRRVGSEAVVVIKDFTTILSMHGSTRPMVLSALREIADGRWSRDAGSGGGKLLEWNGRIVIIGAVTSAYDRAQEAIALMGDRFLVVRVDSSIGRLSAARQAIANTGHEANMRAELKAAVESLMSNTDLSDTVSALPVGAEIERLLLAGDLAAMSRSATEKNYQGNVVDSNQPEAATRISKSLAALFRGAILLGHTRGEAMSLAIRCARDSVPPLRLLTLMYVAANPHASATEVAKQLDKPRSTIDRVLQELNLLDVLSYDESYDSPGAWRYVLAPGIDVSAFSDGDPLEPEPVEQPALEPAHVAEPAPTCTVDGCKQVLRDDLRAGGICTKVTASHVAARAALKKEKTSK